LVAIDISLERNEYAAGETVKGTLVISADKDFNVQGFELSVSGEERIIETSNNISKQTEHKLQI
jgi:hypothetical protein